MKAVAGALSVAVSTRDRIGGLARCVDGVLAGSILPAELVVIDQSEGDGTATMLEGRHWPVPLRYARRPPTGLSASRNAALATATAVALAVTDDDCVPDPDWVATLAATFDADLGLAAVTGRVLPLGPPVAGRHAVSSRTSGVAREFGGRVSPWLVGTGANFAVRRSAALAVGGYDERLGVGSRGGAGEDLDLQDRLLAQGGRIRYEPGALVYHERQEWGRRLASRTSYGRGVGACCGLRLRRRDLFAVPMLTSWVGLRGRVLATGLLARRPAALHEEWLVLRGTLSGLAYGFRAGGGPPATERP